LEQVVPELGQRKQRRNNQVVLEEAVLDVELFGHPTAPDRLLDGTVRHPAAEHVVDAAARCRGAAAADGVSCKDKRYPPRAGKSVIAFSVETWGFIDPKVEALFEELAVLAARRQCDRGLQPTKWRSRWLTLISVGLALDAGKAILAAIPLMFKPAPVVANMEPVM
jgi:hypothetical protein